MNNDKAVEEFERQFCPFGYRDISRALEVYAECGKTTTELVEEVNRTIDEVEIKLEDIDVVYLAYYALYQEARSDIERETGVDICNDEPYSRVNIYANYMCTEFDAKEEDSKALRTLIETIKEEDRTEVIQWLCEEMDV